MAQQLTNPARLPEDAGSNPSLTQWVKDLVLLWAVVWVADMAQIWCCCNSDWTASLGTYICHGWGPEKQSKKKKKKRNVTNHPQKLMGSPEGSSLPSNYLTFSLSFCFIATSPLNH